jgi:hypothetical protein
LEVMFADTGFEYFPASFDAPPACELKRYSDGGAEQCGRTPLSSLLLHRSVKATSPRGRRVFQVECISESAAKTVDI